MERMDLEWEGVWKKRTVKYKRRKNKKEEPPATHKKIKKIIHHL
jgi:hypothetical protein